MQAEDGSFSLWKGLASGMLAGALGQFFASPTDRVKVQMQLDGKHIAAGGAPRYTSTFNAFRVIGSQGGIRGLWKVTCPHVYAHMCMHIYRRVCVYVV